MDKDNVRDTAGSDAGKSTSAGKGTSEGQGTSGGMGEVRQTVMEEARHTYEDVKDETMSQARETKEHVKQAAVDSVESSASRLSSKVGSVAKAMHRGGESFREDGEDALAEQVEHLADRVDSVRSYLDDQGAQGLYDEVRRMSRERPLLVFGGALAVGAAAAAVLAGGRGGRRR